ncbi:hypothetical protein [Niallia sp. FSL M8-0099]|uniref:hypothetical protein n=1 Tax=Niallia sp. FSL M8-0099 TaxID=2954519 RepID=UPI0030F9E02D
MNITEGYLITLSDDSHLLVTKRYYDKYNHMPEFIEAKETVKHLDLQQTIKENPHLEVWY